MPLNRIIQLVVVTFLGWTIHLSTVFASNEKRIGAIASYESGSYNAERYNDDSVKITHDAQGNEIRDRVFFGYNSSSLSPIAKIVVDNQIKWLKENSSVRVLIEGHADERGTREYNLALAERRARSVADYLALRGINRSRLRVVSYGEEKPSAFGNAESSHSLNRRVEVKY